MSLAKSPGGSPECDRISKSDCKSECDRDSQHDSCGSKSPSNPESDRLSECDKESDGDSREPTYDSCMSEADDTDSYICDSDQDDPGPAVRPELLNDIRLLKETCPRSCCFHKSLHGLNEMDLEISFPTTLLERNIATAWGLIYGEPVVVCFCLDQKLYLDTEARFKIEVSQKGHTTGVLMQLKRIVEEFCNRQIKKLSNDIVRVAVENTLGFGLCQGAASLANADGSAQNSPLLPQYAKVIPSLNCGFLVQLYLYIEQRLLTLNSFCPVCDNCHSSVVCMMLKPVVCSNPLCTFSYHTLGVMAGAADIVISEPQVVNLLIHLTKVAAGSLRQNIIFQPYPSIVHPTNVNELAIHPCKKDFTLLNEILEKMPTVAEMVNYNETELEMILQTRHELCYPLLRWIISSNRSHIVKLPADKQLTFLATNHQFLMRNSPPLEDREFRRKKEIFGSVFAFHGSPIENWHSIIREGLVVATATSQMLHGCKYGKGIYLSPHLGTAMGYSCSPKQAKPKKLQRGGQSNEEFIEGDWSTLVCITLCEVINCENLKKFAKIWVCDRSEFVCTRFFFVYDKYNEVFRIAGDAMTTDPIIHGEIEMTLAAEG